MKMTMIMIMKKKTMRKNKLFCNIKKKLYFNISIILISLDNNFHNYDIQEINKGNIYLFNCALLIINKI